MTYKSITPGQAKKINLKLGLETLEDDGQKTFWITNEDESETWYFDTNYERKEFLKQYNK